MRRRWLFGLGAVVLAVGIGLATAATRGTNAQETPAETLFTVRRGHLSLLVSDTGTLRPLARVALKSKVAGRVQSFRVREGDTVRAGQLLALIDPIEIQSQVDQIRSQIDAAEARLSQARTARALEGATSALALKDGSHALRAARARLAAATRQAGAQPTLTRAAVDQAIANLQAARAAQAALRDTQTQSRADARSALDQASSSAETTRRTLARYNALKGQGFVSQNQLDAVQRDYELALAQREAAQKRWESLDEQHAAQRRQAAAEVAQMEAALATAKANGVQDDLRGDDMQAARAELAQAEVAYDRVRAVRMEIQARDAAIRAAQAEVTRLTGQLREMKVRLADTRIIAPMSGVVTRRYVEPGELVTSGIATFSSGTPLLEIARLDRMRVECQVNEVDVGRIRVGQAARVRLDAAGGRSYAGEVVSVAPSAGKRVLPGEPEGAPGSQGGGASGSSIVRFEVSIELSRPDERVKPGMSARVDIVVLERRGVLLLPEEAVEEKDGAGWVTVLRGEKRERVKVGLGERSAGQVEITSGVKEGDRVTGAAFAGPKRRSLEFDVKSE